MYARTYARMCVPLRPGGYLLRKNILDRNKEPARVFSRSTCTRDAETVTKPANHTIIAAPRRCLLLLTPPLCTSSLSASCRISCFLCRVWQISPHRNTHNTQGQLQHAEITGKGNTRRRGMMRGERGETGRKTQTHNTQRRAERPQRDTAQNEHTTQRNRNTPAEPRCPQPHTRSDKKYDKKTKTKTKRPSKPPLSCSFC